MFSNHHTSKKCLLDFYQVKTPKLIVILYIDWFLTEDHFEAHKVIDREGLDLLIVSHVLNINFDPQQFILKFFWHRLTASILTQTLLLIESTI